MIPREITAQGLWGNNPVLVQMLGLCPLLAVSNTLVTGFSLGIITLLILTASNTVVSLIRGFLDDSTRLPAQIMVIAAFVTCADILLQAWLFELHVRISLFVALIVTNCTLLGRAEVFASRQPVSLAALDGFMMGAGFLWVITLLAGIRELLGQGTLLSNAHLLFGESAQHWEIQIMDGGLLLMILPPGAFITLGFIIAGKNWIEIRRGATSTAIERARINLRQLD